MGDVRGKSYGEDNVQREELGGEEPLHEEDAFLRYDPEEILPQAGQQGHTSRRREESGDTPGTIERLEDDQAGNSIQGLLAASRMINSGRDLDHQLLANQVSKLYVDLTKRPLLIYLLARLERAA
jgi:hypothetical protein